MQGNNGPLLLLPPPSTLLRDTLLLLESLSLILMDRSSTSQQLSIFQNWTGRLLQTGSTHYGTASILVAEDRAMRDGLYAAVQVRYHNIIVEGDIKSSFRLVMN